VGTRAKTKIGGVEEKHEINRRWPRNIIERLRRFGESLFGLLPSFW